MSHTFLRASVGRPSSRRSQTRRSSGTCSTSSFESQGAAPRFRRTRSSRHRRSRDTLPMRLIFCSDPLSPRRADEAFTREVEAASALGISVDLVDHDALTRNRLQTVTRGLEPLTAPELSVY